MTKQTISFQNARPVSAAERKSPSAGIVMTRRVSKELESMRCAPVLGDGVPFPIACRTMLYSLPGNTRCADCQSARPEWASVTYGIVLCVNCSGRHRSYGVSVSRVRSIDMDAWSQSHVLAMLEGGNDQLNKFFDRHRMGEDDGDDGNNMIDRRYQTKAALFYRFHLKNHVEVVASSGEYKGRETARRKYQAKEKLHETAVAASKVSTVIASSKAPTGQ